VLLVLHGGPGWPNAVFTLPLRPWERDFTLVQWDHRGAGKTLRRNGKAGSGEMTFDQRVADAELMAYDAWRMGGRFEVPFFLFQGERDVVTLTSLATEYFQEVQAPAKELALIPDAGHFAAFTQPDRFLTELLTRVRPLAAAPSPTSIRKA
jgi:pimeloyl-ACP methyl ester carboxylesterase